MLHDAYCSFSGNSAEQFWNNQRARQLAWRIVNIYIIYIIIIYTNIYNYIYIYVKILNVSKGFILIYSKGIRCFIRPAVCFSFTRRFAQLLGAQCGSLSSAERLARVRGPKLWGVTCCGDIWMVMGLDMK